MAKTPTKEEAIPLHKKLAMGQKPNTGADNANKAPPKTPA